MDLFSLAFWRRRVIDLRIYIESLTGIGQRDVVSLHGNLFDLTHPRMSGQTIKALHYGSYEAPEIRLIGRNVAPGDRVIELGVGIGATSMVLSDIVGPENLLVFDIDRRNIDLAQRNFELNGKSIKCRNYALVSGLAAPDSISVISNSNPAASATASMSQPGGEVEFVVETLDFEKTLCEFGATALVLDIEGSEVDLLTNAMEFGAVKTIVMETHPAFVGNDNIRSMLERLERAGFRVAEHTSGGAVVALRR